jgi:predicted TIM-barrel fold metal-dependent hydrolase
MLMASASSALGRAQITEINGASYPDGSMCAHGDEQDIPWPVDRVLPGIIEGDLPAGTALVSVDSHIMEPTDWAEWMPAKLRDRAPKQWRDDVGNLRFSYDGVEVDDHFDPCVMEGREGLHDVEARMRDLNAEGIAKDLMYPQRSFGLLAGMRRSHEDIVKHDEEYAMAYIRAYNAYVAHVSEQYPDRLYGVAILNFWNPAMTADHIAEIKEQGLKAIVIPTSPPGVAYNDPKMDPMWAAIAESGMPLSFHVGEKFTMDGPGVLGVGLMMNFHPFRRLWSMLTFAGVFDRHPALQVVFTEGQLHWVPGALDDADRIVRSFGSLLQPKLEHLPSYYWFQNCYATFQEDEVGMSLLDRIGADRVLWATDYPHSESTLGRSREAAQRVFEATTESRAKDILGGTAIKLWNL